MRFFRSVLLLALAALLPACGASGGGTLTPTIAPASPTGLSSKSGNGRVTLTWTASPAAKTYNVQRSVNSDGPFVPLLAAQDLPTTSFIDTNLPNGSVFYYVVQAANSFGLSQPSFPAEGTPRFSAVVAAGGGNHFMVLLTDGTVWCWGSNVLGELGTGSLRTFSTIGVQVPLDDVTGLASGGFHSAALRRDGTVWSWGSNEYGESGDPAQQTGTNSRINSPIPVPGLSGVVSLAAGTYNTLALLADGTVRGWGRNSTGQVTMPTTSIVPAPTPVAGLPSGITAISAGMNHSIAVDSDGNAWAWGNNHYGQLGDGTFLSAAQAPGQVSNLRQVVAVACGANHTLALRSDGSVWAWGQNGSGQIGNGGSLTSVLTPVPVAGLTNVTAIAAGDSFSLAVRADGTVWGWGGNSANELARPSPPASYTTPVQVLGVSNIRSVTACMNTALALHEDGTMFTWGSGASGELGGGVGAIQDAPLPVANVTSAVSCAAGAAHSLAIRSDGSLWSWGANDTGMLGNGTLVSSSYRVPVTFSPALPPGVTVASAAGGSTHSIARLSNGTVWAWGAAIANGTGGVASIPVQVGTPANVTAVSAGLEYSLALVGAAGTVWFWGKNSLFGLRGNGSTNGDFPNPVQVPISGVSAISCGRYTSLALKSNGTVWGWGYNALNQVGVPGPSPVLSPVQVPGLSSIIAVSAGDNHSLALKSDGTVWAWGSNGNGELGLGYVGGYSATPSQVAGLTGVAMIEAGGGHNLAVLADGTLMAWGWNAFAQLGDNDTLTSGTPQAVPGIRSPLMLSAGERHTVVLLSDGSLWAWGFNQTGQIGMGTGGLSSVPLVVKQ